ncbi:MAG: LysE family transporter [Candidatus Aminicenantes bacterium]|nr:LysE family transporter [Candidatus Aminicenantes bacterium]
MSVYLITGLTFGFAAAVTPGPLLTYLISQTLNNGWRRTLPAVFSPLITDGPTAVLILSILSRVPPSLIGYLQLVGGIFILYLAYGAFKAWRVYDIKKTVSVQSIRQNVLKAAIVNWLNPNPYLGWSLVLGPLLLKGWREAPVNGIILLVSFYGIMFASMTAIIMLFHAARNLGPKVNRAMIGLSAAALACFGLYQWWSGIKAIW